jgi:anti-sigma factor RsiW
MSIHEMTDQVALYALDALRETEIAEFESHLELCGECRAQLVTYRTVASNLVHDEAPSEHTWQRIRASIAANPETSVAEVAPLPRSRGTSSTWRWVASIAAAAALLFGGFLLAQLITGTQSSDQNVIAAADEAAAQPGSIVSDFVVGGVPVAHVVLAQDGRGFLVPTEDMEPLDPSRTYQLWVINETSDAISAGVLGADPAPATFTWTGSVSGFALTREAAGGVVSSAGDVVSVIEDV